MPAVIHKIFQFVGWKEALAQKPMTAKALKKNRNKELEAEGFSREITRRVQELRKTSGMVKTDRIELFIKTDREMVDMIKHWAKQIKEKVGALKIDIDTSTSESYDHESTEKVKGKEFVIMINKV